MLNEAVMPPKFNQPKKVVQTLKEIWTGSEMMRVRRAHGKGNLESINICKKCSFKDTYNWQDK